MQHQNSAQRMGMVARLTVLISLTAMLTGCGNGCKPAPEGEILHRRQLLEKHNARAEQFVRLWSKCRITVRMPREFDEQTGGPAPGTSYQSHSIDGNFILRKPRDLYLEGRVFGTSQFGLHSNSAMYWLYIKPANVEYVGRYGGAGLERFPIPPDQLLRGLGIYTVGSGQELLAFRRGDAMDILQIIRPYTQRDLQRVSQDGFGPVYIAEEIYLDRVRHLPAEVRLYDLVGDVLVHSSLENYRAVKMHPQVELTEAQLAEDPFAVPVVDRSVVLGEVQVAHRLVFRMPARGVTVTLTLSDVDLSLELEDEVFQRRPAPVERTIDLDAEHPEA